MVMYSDDPGRKASSAARISRLVVPVCLLWPLRAEQTTTSRLTLTYSLQEYTCVNKKLKFNDAIVHT